MLNVTNKNGYCELIFDPENNQHCLYHYRFKFLVRSTIFNKCDNELNYNRKIVQNNIVDLTIHRGRKKLMKKLLIVKTLLRDVAEEICVSHGSCEVVFTGVSGIGLMAMKFVPI